MFTFFSHWYCTFFLANDSNATLYRHIKYGSSSSTVSGSGSHYISFARATFTFLTIFSSNQRESKNCQLNATKKHTQRNTFSLNSEKWTRRVKQIKKKTTTKHLIQEIKKTKFFFPENVQNANKKICRKKSKIFTIN